MSKRMMFGLFAVIAVGALLLAFCGTSGEWKTVKIEGFGEIRIPGDWVEANDGGFLCISDGETKDGVPILIQHTTNESINSRFSTIEHREWIWDENFSNSASLTKYKAHYADGTTKELFALEFSGPDNYETTEFLCVSDSVSEEMLRKITKTFIMQTEE